MWHQPRQRQRLLTPLILKSPKLPLTELGLTIVETRSILGLAFPMIISGLLLYMRSVVSMLFLGRLGSLPLAGGSLAMGFANITGYSVLSGLAMGMEPICGQAFGARRHPLLRLALRRTVLLLLAASLPIAALWLNMRRLLLVFGQDPYIVSAAHSYLIYSVPDLLLQSFLHPIRIYLRTQSITLPLTYAAAAALLLHLPINYLLVSVLGLGIRGVALASVFTNLNLVLILMAHIYFSGVYELDNDTMINDSNNNNNNNNNSKISQGWHSLLNLAIPSCVSVCLEWWWYEIIILLCGLLADPKSTVASMGILIQTTSLIYIFPSSLSFGVSTRVSNELGANNPGRASRAAKVGLACGAAMGFAALAFAALVGRVWAGAFTSDPVIRGMTTAALPILGLCELGNCPQTIGCGVLRGSARPRVAANVNVAAFYLVGMPVGVWLGFWGGVGLRGLWVGMMAAQVACVVGMVAAVRGMDWEKQAERAQKLTGGEEEVEGEVKKLVGGGGGGDEEDGLVLLIDSSTQSSLN